MREFIDDDPGYLGWLAANPDGYVINSYRLPVAGYLMLHRSGCRTVNGQPPTGDGWTSTSKKVCGTREELEKWVRDSVGGDLTACGTCLG